jgi:hypothetical protein
MISVIIKLTSSRSDIEICKRFWWRFWKKDTSLRILRNISALRVKRNREKPKIDPPLVRKLLKTHPRRALRRRKVVADAVQVIRPAATVYRLLLLLLLALEVVHRPAGHLVGRHQRIGAVLLMNDGRFDVPAVELLNGLQRSLAERIGGDQLQFAEQLDEEMGPRLIGCDEIFHLLVDVLFERFEQLRRGSENKKNPS